MGAAVRSESIKDPLPVSTRRVNPQIAGVLIADHEAGRARGRW